MKKPEIAVGAKYKFVPDYPTSYGSGKKGKKVTGTIVYVNHAHRYFRVEYPAGNRGKRLSECFKF